jgi:hypothetical protein
MPPQVNKPLPAYPSAASPVTLEPRVDQKYANRAVNMSTLLKSGPSPVTPQTNGIHPRGPRARPFGSPVYDNNKASLVFPESSSLLARNDEFALAPATNRTSRFYRDPHDSPIEPSFMNHRDSSIGKAVEMTKPSMCSPPATLSTPQRYSAEKRQSHIPRMISPSSSIGDNVLAPRLMQARRTSSVETVIPRSSSRNSNQGQNLMLNNSDISPGNSRPHSPSPGSFSQPLLGNTNLQTRIPSLAKRSSSSLSLRPPSMASRLPITNSKRATVIDVKPRSPPEPAAWQTSQHEAHAPLKLPTPTSTPRDGARNASLRRSVQTGPYLHADLLNNSSEESLEAEKSPLFRKAPPSRSPFTPPLQTIKSEGMLPNLVGDDCKGARDSMDVTRDDLSPKVGPSQEIEDTSKEHGGGAFPEFNGGTHAHIPAFATDMATSSLASNTSDERLDLRTSLIEKAVLAATYVTRADGMITEQNIESVIEEQQIGLQPSGSLSKWSTSSRSDGSPPGGPRIMRRASDTIKRVRTPIGFHQETLYESPKSASPRSVRPRKAGLKTTRDRSGSPFPLQGPSPRSKKQTPDGSPKKSNTTVSLAMSDDVAQAESLGLSVNETSASEALDEIDRGRARNGDSTPKVVSLPREQSRSRLVLHKLNRIFSGNRSRKAAAPPVPPIPQVLKHKRSRNNLREKSIAPRKSNRNLNAMTPQPKASSPHLIRKSPPAKSQSPLPMAPRRAPLKKPMVTALPHQRSTSMTTHPSVPPLEPSFPLRSLSIDNSRALTSRLIQIAQSEPSPSQRERLFHFASILTDAVVQAREAEISAETAAAAARSAAISHQMTVTAVEMIGKLVGGLGVGVGSAK